MPPPFENFSFDALNSEQKPSIKNRSAGRSTGVDFEIYQSGRVEKILTGSTSGPFVAILLHAYLCALGVLIFFFFCETK